MILLIDTSTAICKITLIDNKLKINDEWQADRMLANNLLSHLNDLLKSNKKKWTDITAVGAFAGPGSFTGLRIGLTVMNTIADSQGIPIVGARGDNWQDEALSKINSGKNEKIVLPFYGSEAHITQPKK